MKINFDEHKDFSWNMNVSKVKWAEAMAHMAV